MGEEGAFALQAADGSASLASRVDLGIGELAAEGAPHRLDRLRRRGFVEGDAEHAAKSAWPIRKLMFSASARATISFCCSPTSTDTVSKNASDRGAKPSLRNPAASTAARRCTVRAMWVSPSGP